MSAESSSKELFVEAPEATDAEAAEFKTLFSAIRGGYDADKFLALYYFLEGKKDQLESLVGKYIAQLPESSKRKINHPLMLEKLGQFVEFMNRNIGKIGRTVARRENMSNARIAREKNAGEILNERLSPIIAQKRKDKEELELATDSPEDFWRMMENIG